MRPAPPKGLSNFPTVAARTEPVTDPTAPPQRLRAVQLPEDLVQALEARMRGTSFGSIDDFVTFVLARLLDQPTSHAFTEEEERSLRERLRSLGYID